MSETLKDTDTPLTDEVVRGSGRVQGEKYPAALRLCRQLERALAACEAARDLAVAEAAEAVMNMDATLSTAQTTALVEPKEKT